MKPEKVASGSSLLQRGVFCLDICGDLPEEPEFLLQKN